MSTFHSFTRLPAEIRFMVWEHAKWPRIVRLKYAPRLVVSNKPAPDHNPQDDQDPQHDQDSLWVSTSSAPATFHVCKEARAVAETLYRKSFRSPPSSSPECYAWVDFETDIIRTPAAAAWLLKENGSDCGLIRRLQLVCSNRTALDELCDIDFTDFVALESVEVINDNCIDFDRIQDAVNMGYAFRKLHIDKVWIVDKETGIGRQLPLRNERNGMISMSMAPMEVHQRLDEWTPWQLMPELPRDDWTYEWPLTLAPMLGATAPPSELRLGQPLRGATRLLSPWQFPPI